MEQCSSLRCRMLDVGEVGGSVLLVVAVFKLDSGFVDEAKGRRRLV